MKRLMSNWRLETGAAKHGAEGGEKGEVGEQGGAEGEEGEAEDRMMERGKGVEGEAAAEQGGAEGEEGEAEDRLNKREKGVEGGAEGVASGVEGAAEIVERVNLAAGLEVEEGAKEWDEEEEGVPQPSLCHLSALASLPLTGDPRGGGRERRGCAWASLLLLGYFQPRCSHPALPLPSLRPCLPAIDRRCTEEEGGRGGGVHGPLCSYWAIFSPAVLTQPSLCHLSALASLPLTGDARRRREGEAGVCMGLSAPIGIFSAPHPAVLTQPYLCHLSALASLPLTGDARGGGRERRGCAWASLLLLGYFQPRCSHPALPLPSLRPCLPAIDRRCTEEEGGRGGGVHGPLCSYWAIFSPAVLTQPYLCHLSALASLPLTGDARGGGRERRGPAVLTQPYLCHLSALASLPLTGDARGGGRERRGCAWASLLLLGYFQPRSSHPALPLPSLRPCLPAIDRRCTEEEGGRGGGVHGPLCSYWAIFSPAVLTKPSLCHLSALASLPLTGDARRRREGEAGVCMGLSAPIGLFSAPLPAVLTQPYLCHLSALASLPLTGDARGGGRERRGCAWASLLLLGYFQPRCSHPALPLPSLRPCLPAIDRRCTEEEGGRGGGVHGPLCSYWAIFSPAVLTQPSLCHLSALASLPLTGDARGGGRERRGCAWASLLLLGYFQPRCSHPALPLPSLRPCLPAIDRRCTEEDGGRGGGVHGPLCSYWAIFSPAVLTQPSLCHLSALASLPLTGDARRRRVGEAGPRCSHPALPLPSLRPCLPAIDRRCTEEEGGRGGGVHGPLCSYWAIFSPAVLTQPSLCHLSALASLPLTGDARRRREGEAGVCMGLSAPIGLFSAPLPAVLTQPSLCHLSALASLPLTGDARRRREGEAGVCMGLSAPIGLFSAPLFSPSPTSAISPPLPPCH
ncbi:unnamed protein product [Closterium sp. Naga37s-1]|nr:unnamed protein product [Closterium sp. Naga37s-1]